MMGLIRKPLLNINNYALVRIIKWFVFINFSNISILFFLKLRETDFGFSTPRMKLANQIS
jgi:hypothetical protein